MSITRLLIAADVHLGLPETQLPGQAYEFAPSVLRAAVPKMLELAADQVIIVGDLLNTGHPGEVALAREVLGPLGDRVRVVAGNHDLIDCPLSKFHAEVPGAVSDAVIDAGNHLRVYLRSGIERQTITQWHGVVGDSGLKALDEARGRAAARPLLVFCHHPPAGTVRTMQQPMMNLVGGEAVMDRLISSPTPVVLFVGHNHVADLWRARNLTIVAVPPLAFWPHGFIECQIDGSWMTLNEHRIYTAAEQSPHAESRQSAGFRALQESRYSQLRLRLSDA